MLDRHLGIRQRADDLVQQPPRHHRDAFVRDLRLHGGAKRQLHVGRRQVQAAGLGAKLNPAEDEDGRTRRDTSGDQRQPCSKIVARDGNPQPGAHHYL